MAFTEYYVDPSGGDDVGGDGSSGNPWQTFEHAITNITRDGTNGDRINVRDTATDTLSAAPSISTYATTATAAAPLVIQGYTTTAGDGGIGVIDGAATYAFFSGVAGFDHLYMADMQVGNCGSADIINCDNDCMFFNCYFHDTTGDGIFCQLNTAIIACRFESVGSDSATTHGINASVAHDSIFAGNYMITGSSGVENHIFAASSSINVRIVANILSDTGGNGWNRGIMNATLTARCTNMLNSILCAAQATDGLFGYVNGSMGNIVEGLSGSGGDGITYYGDFETMVYANATFNCDDDYDEVSPVYQIPYLIADSGWDNEVLSQSGFDKSGSDTYANRATYYNPVDTGSIVDGVWGIMNKGAVQDVSAPAAGDTETVVMSTMSQPIVARMR